mgnify:CR=1 FL=1|tara:strand:- start:2258 stop:2659 length:402 start_codon:yes stop_codon:yes gene_type:complete
MTTDIENMPDILKRCKQYDPNVLFVVGRPKDCNVVCYVLENEIIKPYWRMEDGSKVEASYFEKLVLAVEQREGQSFNIVSLPHIVFTLTGGDVFYSEKNISFVFLGRPKHFFSPVPSHIILKYTDNSFGKLDI